MTSHDGYVRHDAQGTAKSLQPPEKWVVSVQPIISLIKWLWYFGTLIVLIGIKCPNHYLHSCKLAHMALEC